MSRDTDDDWGALKAALWDASAFLRGPQPRAAAPAPEAGMRQTSAEAKNLRYYADMADEDTGYVEISPDALRRWADLFDALYTTPPRPAMDPETRQVLSNLIAAADETYEAYGGRGYIAYHTLGGALDAARAHLAAHGGGDE
jgi:hypothetical protein